MDPATLTRIRDELARDHGPWQDNLLLAEGVYTVGERATHDHVRVKAILQAAADALPRPLEDSRVLDLGAAEGLFAIEFARQGAEVVAIEGRPGNVAKARFVKHALGLERLEIFEDDVRNLTRERYGEFDLVLCLGILYHLEGPAAVRLVHRVAEVCRRAAVVDTQVSLTSRRTVAVDGGDYRGRRVREFDPGAPAQEQEELSRSSIHNPESLWLTRPSLFNLLADAGFTSVAELRVPRVETWASRITLLAFRGSPREVISAPSAEGPPRWREHGRLPPHPSDTWRAALRLRFAPWVPMALKRWARRRRKRG